MDKIGVDIMKVPESDDGHNSIMVASDHFTKYSEFYALKDNTAQTCADKLCTEFFIRFGVPLVLHSDGGKNFESDLLKGVCEVLDIHKTKTARYRPQGNSVIERNNRTLKKMLKSVVEENPKSWPDMLPFLQQAFNATVHSATKCTPNLLMFGTENRTPVDIIFNEGVLEEPTPQCKSAYVQWLRGASREAFSKARHYLQNSVERQKTYYDRNSFVRKFKPGDWVWVFYPPELHNKLSKTWLGPYLVVVKLGPVNYIVQENKNSRKITLHIDHMKKYEHDDTPEVWLELSKMKNCTKYTQTD